MTCTVDKRQRVHRARDRLEAHTLVVGAAVLAPAEDPTARWTLELTLDAAGVPHDVLDILGSYRLTLRTAAPRGRCWHAVAVA